MCCPHFRIPEKPSFGSRYEQREAVEQGVAADGRPRRPPLNARSLGRNRQVMSIPDEYDVFLSHNRRDKPWVRRLYELLTAHGLRVFFDEESVRPGQSIVTAIEAALERSRHVVLVLSPASVSSRWVALESQLSIYDDPDSRGNRLIPVIVENVNWSKVRPVVRTLNCVDLTEASSRADRLGKLLAALGVRTTDRGALDALLAGIEARPLLQPLAVAGLGDVLDWDWTGEKLLEAFIALDYATLEGLTAAHEGSPRQWAPVFMNHPETWRMLVSAPEEIRGYWHFAPLFPEDYERARNGRLLDSEITADRIRLFELPGEYEIYFVQLCMHQRFRHPAHVRQLFRSIFDVLEELADQGIFVRELCANAYTDIGRAICKSCNLSLLCEHVEHGSIFGSPIRNVLTSQFAGLNRRLVQMYHDAQLV